MWSTLVGLIERWWKEKPRLDIVRAVVRLRDAMVSCQAAYAKYHHAHTQTAKIDRAATSDLRTSWEGSIDTLGESLRQLDSVMQIFSPELHRHSFLYQLLEIEQRSRRVVFAIANALNEEPDIDVENVRLGSTYLAALNELDAFIRANFRPEEILAVQESGLR